MPPGSSGPLDAVSQRFCDLAHKRLAYYSDLAKSGRWKRYFTEREFIERLREVVALAKTWNNIAGREPPDNVRDAA